MGRPREAIDAAMLAAAIGVDRAVEADVGRLVAGQDRLGMFDRDRGPALRNAVQRFDTVEPVAVDQPLLQVEARRRALRVAPRPLIDSTGMQRDYAAHREQNKNEIRFRVRRRASTGSPPQGWCGTLGRPASGAGPARSGSAYRPSQALGRPTCSGRLPGRNSAFPNREWLSIHSNGSPLPMIEAQRATGSGPAL